MQSRGKWVGYSLDGKKETELCLRMFLFQRPLKQTFNRKRLRQNHKFGSSAQAKAGDKGVTKDFERCTVD